MSDYDIGGFYDEMYETEGGARAHTSVLVQRLASMTHRELRERQVAAERALLTRGITFNVYGATDGVEKIMPFDILPRVVSAAEWKTVERGLIQRVRALNDFIADIYGPRKILAAGVIPESILQSSRGLLPACNGMKPPKGIWCHIVGTDLVRDRDGQMYVLEDNLRCPSGVSYVLENRQVMKRTFPMVFEQLRVRPVDGYAGKLLETLQHLSPIPNPTVVVLTPGVYNSAYFEHSFLAQQMGVELVEGRDLVVMDGRVHMRTTRGFQRVDVIYRRIDDTFLDPDELREDSMLGVRGLLDVYRKGKVALANAPGTGVADDKVIYRYVPAMIEYYLGEKAILPNVPTFVCADDADRRTVLDDLSKFVVKPANESGGYGIVIGPQATPQQLEECRSRILTNPREYIAQPMIGLSRVPTIVEDEILGRHVDLRPYVLFGEDIYVLPGGLTRVALRAGSPIVNSSQGGGSKDTWVLADDEKTSVHPQSPPVGDHEARQSQSQGGQSPPVGDHEARQSQSQG